MATFNVVEQSSPEIYDEGSSTALADHWPSNGQTDQDQTLTEGGRVSSSQQPHLPPQLQKRRRVTRACDECRRKKIKCDGKQPCTHCTVYSYDCTYDQPSNRRRNPAPQYIEAIEIRLHRAEALLKTVLPNVDLDDSKYDAVGYQPMKVSAQEHEDGNGKEGGNFVPATRLNIPGELETDSMLESMVKNTGSLDLDDRGFWDFHGHSSGLVFLRRMREQFGDMMGESEAQGTPFAKPRASAPAPFFTDSPSSAGDSPPESNIPNTHDLPSKKCARKLSEATLNEACAIFRFIHQPTFWSLFERIYEIPPDRYGNEENRFLPLLYMVLAVGCLFAKHEKSVLKSEGYENAIDQGFKFFKASRQMMDITDCRDLTSLQAVVFMIMFLQSSAKLATCYSYIGIALRSAIRMGMHRSISRSFNPIELETRRRIFWTIRKMDIYVGALLGLPEMLSEEDIDQELPQEVDDEFITAEKILPMPIGRVSQIAAANAHTRLLKILQKVVRYIYPIKGLAHKDNQSNQTYVVSHAKIREIERDLQEWMETLSMSLRPGGDVPMELARVQQLLRVAYAHVQMMLYRPFLHYVSQSCQTGNIDKRSYACAAACVSVSRNIVHITAEMKKRGLLKGAYWFTMYTTFFAILSLIFYVFENTGSLSSQDILKDAMDGKDILASIADYSMAADRCTVTLQALFGQLPEKLRRSRIGAVSTRKRQATSPNPGVKAVQSSPDVMNGRSTGLDEKSNVRRASTFPMNSSSVRQRSSAAYENAASTHHKHTNSDTSYSNSPSGTYTPTTSETFGVHTPESNNGATFSNGPIQQPFNYQQDLVSTNLPDLTAMMFPSGDPFAYPNQPMITLEDRQFIKSEPGFGSSTAADMFSMNPTVSSAGPYNMSSSFCPDPQLYGSIPSYMMAGQATPGLGMQNVNLTGSRGNPDVGVMAMNGGGGLTGWPEQTARTGTTPGVNLDELFGEGWMDQGYV